MNESAYTRSIIKKLPREIYSWKIMNMMQNGVPDCYFSGKKQDLWLEVKYIIAPKRDTTLIKPDLSALQLKWLNERYNEGRSVAVLLGSDIGAHIFLYGAWNKPITRSDLTLTKQDVIRWITGQTLGFEK